MKSSLSMQTMNSRNLREKISSTGELLAFDLLDVVFCFNGTLRYFFSLREDLKFMKQKLKKLEEKVRKDSTKLCELDHEVASLRADVPEVNQRAENLTVQLKKGEEV